MNRLARSAATLLALLAANAAPALSQQPTASPDAPRDLAAIDALIADARLPEARLALDRWNRNFPSHTGTTPPALRAHALMLQARLATVWADAEEAFLAVALGYPTSDDAPEALLRLGQGLLTAARAHPTRTPNAATRAEAYLLRLVTDYPTSTLRPHALLWLARTLRFTGRVNAACARLESAAQIQTDPSTTRLIDEERRACASLSRTVEFLAK